MKFLISPPIGFQRGDLIRLAFYRGQSRQCGSSDFIRYLATLRQRKTRRAQQRF
ncbi:MAG: hypothetical protein ACTXOO_02460 [Sodalis sp. (in: enterobacteria)]